MWFGIVHSSVDKDSIFEEARNPASELDLKLSEIKIKWWISFIISPTPVIKKENPLISKARVAIDLNYFGEDRIKVTGWILDANGFISLTTKERKQLLKNIIERIKSYFFREVTIVVKKTGLLTGRSLKNRDIILNIIINEVTENDKNESIRLLLPFEIGVGQAGYKDGRYVYSEDYFLRLTVTKGRAKAGDESKFILEKEK
jgi:small nuclear ribonucleoprotein (snRNP)-like protein